MKSMQFSLRKVNMLIKLVKEKKSLKGWVRIKNNYENEKLKGLMHLVIESGSKAYHAISL